MKITADTNLLIRWLVHDDLRQARLAEGALTQADLVAVTVPAICELVWVLSRFYRASAVEIAAVVRRLTEVANIVVDRPSVDAGLAHLEAGGDFADGVIAYQGALLGADTFVSFDKQAVQLVQAEGGAAHLLA